VGKEKVSNGGSAACGEAWGVKSVGGAPVQWVRNHCSPVGAPIPRGHGGHPAHSRELELDAL